MKLKTNLGIAFLCFVLAVGAIFVFKINDINAVASKPVTKEEIKQNLKQLGQIRKETRKNIKVVAKIDKMGVTNEEFLARKVWLQILAAQNGDKSPTNKDVMNSILRDKVLEAEAARRNLTASVDETKVYLNELRKYQDQSNGTITGREMIQNFAEGLGITEDQYWNEWAVPYYQKELSRAKIAKAIAQEVQPLPNEDSEAYSKRQKEYFEKVVKDLIDKAKVEILDDSIN
ncbi:hypothetical protein Tfer_3296 [Thermincola ferriacetica]|uniref:Uncharacterized protein n=1 Tax=Thermincola ferriacetica TaxID=281456 RepID=A0A0L6VY84_9FIRM|nr:hypothetical protein [Thermincola ferriacetica]KNZ68171.1 hypothetical protein Tfer_3296 [Thermincola ferriacetica]